MALTCLRAQQIYEFLRTSTSDEFLSNWRAIFNELKEPLNSTTGGETKKSDAKFTLEADPVSSPLVVKSAYLALDEFLRVSAQFPNVSKEFITTKLLYVLINRLVSPTIIDEYSLITLRSCLRYYGSASGHFGGRIVKRLYRFVDFPSEGTRRLAAECFAYLPCMGSAGGGEKQSKQSENWQEHAEFLLQQIHDSLQTLLGSNAETLSCDFLPNSITTTKMTSFPPLDALDLEKLNRIDFCATCLKFMLTRHVSNSFYVKIPIKSIIDLLRCFLSALNLHRKLRPEVIQVVIDGMSVLTEAFADLPQILRFTISPYSMQIFDYIESALHAINVLQQNPVIIKTVKLKCALYRLLGEIGRHVSVCSQIHVVLPKFWTYMKRDLQFSGQNESSTADQKQQSNSTNKIDFYPEKYKRGKRKQKSKEHNEPETDFGDQFIKKRPDSTPKRDIVVSAATTLSAIMATCGSAIKASLYRDVQKFVCKLLIVSTISRGHAGSSSNIPEPYDIVVCRTALLELLRNLVLCRHPECAPAVQCAMQIFEAFSTNDREKADIVDLCHNAILALNTATKPRVPSLESCIGINENLNKDTVETNCDDQDNDVDKMEPFSFNNPSTFDMNKDSIHQIQQDIVDSSTTANVLNAIPVVQQEDGSDDDDDICIQDIVDTSTVSKICRADWRDIVDSSTTESSPTTDASGGDLSRRDVVQSNNETSRIIAQSNPEIENGKSGLQRESDNDNDTIIVNIGSESSSDDDDELQEICVFPPPSKRQKIATTSSASDFSSDQQLANSSASDFSSGNKFDQPKNAVASNLLQQLQMLEKSRDPTESLEKPMESVERPIENLEKPKSIEIVNIEELLLDFVDEPAD